MLDVFAVMYRRLRERRSPFAPDRYHLHHLLIDAGLSRHATLAVILAGAVAIWLLSRWIQVAKLGSGSHLLAFVLVAAAYLVLRHELLRRSAAGKHSHDWQASERDPATPDPR